MTEDLIPLGVPFEIGAVFVDALRAAESLAGVTIRDNPVRAADLAEGMRVVWLEDVSDGGSDPTVQARREYRFTIGVINRTADARRGVHTDYRAAKRVIDAAVPLLKDMPFTIAYLREGDLAFRLENLDVGGGLILASFTFGYRDKTGRN